MISLATIKNKAMAYFEDVYEYHMNMSNGRKKDFIDKSFVKFLTYSVIPFIVSLMLGVIAVALFLFLCHWIGGATGVLIGLVILVVLSFSLLIFLINFVDD